MIVADGQVVAVHTIDQSGNATTSYLHSDHLGSVDTLTNDQGTVAQSMSFDAFGLRRDAGNWTYDLTPAQIATLKNDTDRGYTYQEQLDNVGLIHMNGRVYDPMVGRFISADPTVPNPQYSQSFNRYSYVNNSPLESTDPSGFDTDDLVNECEFSGCDSSDGYIGYGPEGGNYNSWGTDPPPGEGGTLGAPVGVPVGAPSVGDNNQAWLSNEGMGGPADLQIGGIAVTCDPACLAAFWAQQAIWAQEENQEFSNEQNIQNFFNQYPSAASCQANPTSTCAFAALLYAEARPGCPPHCLAMMAAAGTVLDRVNSPGFPKTLMGVIFYPGAFDAVSGPSGPSTSFVDAYVFPTQLTGLNAESYQNALEISVDMQSQLLSNPAPDATFFYSGTIIPDWDIHLYSIGYSSVLVVPFTPSKFTMTFLAPPGNGGY
ncbi:MAG: RHS repeat-associated core domain-containing protein [Gammaproteobacteria bacterium]